MKYYLIAGEASGDLHASHLIAALKQEDPEAEFRGFGGDLMEAKGMTLVRHYRDLAFMGVIAVVLHARTILSGMKQCKQDMVAWKPDVVILIDYPGFNMKMAKYVHSIGLCPVYYYIAPKIWAWKEWRIKSIRRYVDELYSILPFEVDFFEKKHGYPIHYVGNPTVDEVARFNDEFINHQSSVISHQSSIISPQSSVTNHQSSVTNHQSSVLNPQSSVLNPQSSVLNHQSSIIALLAGSRTHEIRDNLPRMIEAAQPFMDRYRLVIAGAPGIEADYYKKYIGHHDVEIVYGRTYDLLSSATAALVTSGTATLETALFRVPQVVCYFMQVRQFATFLRKILIKIPYISLVNLVAGREVVPELVAEKMTVAACRRHLASILPGGSDREAQLAGYEDVAARLGEPGAPQRAAHLMVQKLSAVAPFTPAK